MESSTKHILCQMTGSCSCITEADILLARELVASVALEAIVITLYPLSRSYAVMLTLHLLCHIKQISFIYFQASHMLAFHDPAMGHRNSSKYDKTSSKMQPAPLFPYCYTSLLDHYSLIANIGLLLCISASFYPPDGFSRTTLVTEFPGNSIRSSKLSGIFA